MKAYVEGIRYYRSHPDSAMVYLRRFSSLSDPDLRVVYENLRKRIREVPIPTAWGIRTIIGNLKSGKDLNPAQVIDTSFVSDMSAR